MKPLFGQLVAQPQALSLTQHFQTVTQYFAKIIFLDAKSELDTIEVIVNPIPALPLNAIANPNPICEGDTATLSATCTTGTLKWFTEASLTNELLTNQVWPTSNTSYFAICDNGFCKSPSVEVALFVTTKPTVPTLISASPSTICEGKNSNLTGNCSSGVLVWYDSNL